MQDAQKRPTGVLFFPPLAMPAAVAPGTRKIEPTESIRESSIHSEKINLGRRGRLPT
jgi:hypothetical protein